MILIRLLLEEQSDHGLHCCVSPIGPNTSSFTLYETLKIMRDILREIYLYTVSEGQENINSALGIM